LSLIFYNGHSVHCVHNVKKNKTQMKNAKEKIREKVYQTPFIDTHEHLCEESDRLNESPKTDFWINLLRPYLGDDMVSAGLPVSEFERIWKPETSLPQKWKIIEPYWKDIKNTSYAKSILITLKMLYGIDEINRGNLDELQKKYLKLKKKGYYKTVLRDIANIKYCQVNSLHGKCFRETEYPELLKQDLSIVPMFTDTDSVLGEGIVPFSEPTGIKVKNIDDWYSVIDWYFEKYGKKAIAVKSQNAYNRTMDYEKVPKEKAAPVFMKWLKNEKLENDEKKALEDHLFWCAVDKATEYNLPVKLHTGYFAGFNGMPMERLRKHPGELTKLCMKSPKTKFVFMHMTYPYQNELIAIVKHHSNAYAACCWAWIINPIATKNFLKEFLVSAPVSKILTFGGDYGHVEAVVGHAEIARQGITQALTELIDENWFSLDGALKIIEPIMYKNAQKIFS